jgi:phosphohistidine phosphatase
MKTLYIVRHAKSGRDLDIRDFDRPLNERGYSDAHQMAIQLAAKNVQIETFITSPAVRTISTALIFAGHLKFPLDQIILRNQLYDTDLKDYLEVISQISGSSSILLTGHNPTISELAQKLSIVRLNDLKTSEVVVLQMNIESWKEIFNTKAKLNFRLNPASVKED